MQAMEARQLEILVAAVDSGQMARAADHVGLTAQAVSKSIARLEGIFGAPLLERTPRGVFPTPLGEAILPHARQIVAELGALRRRVDDMLARTPGRLVIGLGPIGALSPAGRVLAQLPQIYPRLRLDVVSGIGRTFSRSLGEGAIDLAIASATEPPDPLILSETIGSEPWVVAGRCGHPALTRARGLPDLAGQRWLIGSNTATLDAAIAASFAAAGLSAPAPGTVTTSIAFAGMALRESDDLAVLPRNLVAATPGLLARMFAGCTWVTPLLLMRRRRGHIDPLLADVIERLRRAQGGEAVGPNESAGTGR